MTIRERVAEFEALTRAHPDERFVCLSVAADRHDLLAVGDALAAAFELLAARLAVQTGLGASEWEAILWPEGRAALAAWKAATG